MSANGGDDMATARQKQILKIIIDNYIESAEPVGSKSICDELNVSSATVRNDMAALENEGLIEKTHSSSGRVPTDKGWRYYVEYLMGSDFINDNEDLDPKTYELVDRVFANAIVERDDAIEKACNLLADITNYTSVALGPDSSKNRVSKIELVTLSINKYLMVVITDSGHVETRQVDFTDEDPDPEEVKKVVEILNDVLVNSPLSEVAYRLRYIMDNNLVVEFIKYRESIINNFIDAFMKFAQSNYYVFGSSNLLAQPEFQDSNKVRGMLDVFEQKDLVKIIKEDESGEVQIRIGSETGLEALGDATVISVPYENSKGEKGSIALVGPTRMDYKKIVPLVKYIARDIEKYYGKDVKNERRKEKEKH